MSREKSKISFKSCLHLPRMHFILLVFLIFWFEDFGSNKILVCFTTRTFAAWFCLVWSYTKHLVHKTTFAVWFCLVWSYTKHLVHKTTFAVWFCLVWSYTKHLVHKKSAKVRLIELFWNFRDSGKTKKQSRLFVPTIRVRLITWQL